MALNSRQKRAAVCGVGRPWYRNSHPNSLSAAQRASIGNVYPVAAFGLGGFTIVLGQGSFTLSGQVLNIIRFWIPRDDITSSWTERADASSSWTERSDEDDPNWE